MELYLLTRTEAPVSQAAHELLERLLKEKYHILSPRLCYGPQGKPYLEDGPAFSISHSHGTVAVAIGEKNIGLDLEQVRSYHRLVPPRIMSPGEHTWFRERGELKRDFFTLWTLKESYYKYLGTGLPGFPNGTDFYLQQGSWYLRGQEQLGFTVLEEKSLLMTVCSHEQEKINLHIL